MQGALGADRQRSLWSVLAFALRKREIFPAADWREKLSDVCSSTAQMNPSCHRLHQEHFKALSQLKCSS